jgi:hypothetical protein
MKMSPRDKKGDEESTTASVGIEVVPLDGDNTKHRTSLTTEPSNATLMEDGSTDTRTPPSIKKVPNTPRARVTRREWILAGIGVIALVGLAVGLAVALAPSDDRTTTVQQAESPFPESKAYIDNVCASQDDSSLCQDVCAAAECCTTSGSNSCLSLNADDCLAYAKCHVVLEEKPVAPPAPLDLQDLCLFQNDLTACRNACQVAECCYNTQDVHVESCQATHFLTCLDYAPCQVLSESTSLRPSDTQRLLEICSLSVDGTTPSEECEVACRRASCCWEQGEGSCLQSDFMSCLTYSPCHDVFFRKPNSVVDKPSMNIEQVCSLDRILTPDGYEECKEQCEEAACCSATNPPYNCFKNDPFACLWYSKCELLPLAGGTVPRAPSDLNDICSDIAELGSAELQTCLDYCKQSVCCDADGVENCYNDGNALACDEYQVCKPIYSTLERGHLKSPPKTLSLCTPDNVASEAGYKFCTDICEPAECCNSLGDDSCLLDNIEMCGEWNMGGCYLISAAFARRSGGGGGNP